MRKPSLSLLGLFLTLALLAGCTNSNSTDISPKAHDYGQAKSAFQIDAVAREIVAAVNAGDVEALQALMCLDMKSKVNDLPARIEALFNGVGGEITNFSTAAGSSYDGKRNGERIYQQNFKINFTLRSKHYRLDVLWEVFNSMTPAEEGLRRIFLGDNDALAVLVDLQATEGVECWH